MYTFRNLFVLREYVIMLLASITETIFCKSTHKSLALML